MGTGPCPHHGESALMLTSSGSLTPTPTLTETKNEAASKQFKQFSWDLHGGQSKAPPLDNLQNDIALVRQVFHDWLVVIQSSMHKKNLKQRSEIQEAIRKICQGNHAWKAIFFTGHGYTNGDLCIETVNNPQGQHLTIEQILSIYQKSRKQKNLLPPLVIFIDACYSGHNAQRAQKYSQVNGLGQNVFVYCSSGKFKTSLNTRLGGLLMLWFAERWGDEKSKIGEDEKCYKEIKEMFQSRGPVRYSGGKIQELTFLPRDCK